jgi:hypothetical protein
MNASRCSSAMAASWRHAEDRNGHSVFRRLLSRSQQMEECVGAAQPPWCVLAREVATRWLEIWRPAAVRVVSRSTQCRWCCRWPLQNSCRQVCICQDVGIVDQAFRLIGFPLGLWMTGNHLVSQVRQAAMMKWTKNLDRRSCSL